jgi:predicted secreted acid phosphatase
MYKEVARPVLWSDFDGTAVQLRPKRDPRNWAKYPMELQAGFLEFLQGVEEGGVELAGVVSRRPKLRRYVTQRSMAKLGIDQYLSPQQIVLTGSEKAKGQFLADQSSNVPTAVLEDKPHKLVPEILKGMAQNAADEWYPAQHLVIGVASHDRTKEYMDKLVTQDIQLEHADNLSVVGDEASCYIQAARFSVHAICIGAYSQESGHRFATNVWDTAQTQHGTTVA